MRGSRRSHEALNLLDRHPEVRILFTDINMPGQLDGIQLARKVHRMRSDIRLILTSGRERPRDGEIPDNGHFVPKPYRADSLTRLVREML
jgi:two-component SAPR family response regulator